MSKSRHDSGAEAGVEAQRTYVDVARDCGGSKHTIYAWKAKYGGVDVSEAQEVKQRRCARKMRGWKLVADLSLDKDNMTSVISRNGLNSQY